MTLSSRLADITYLGWTNRTCGNPLRGPLMRAPSELWTQVRRVADTAGGPYQLQPPDVKRLR